MVLWLFPAPMFPSGTFAPLDKLLVFAIPAYALTEILLAAQAYRYDIAATVRARAVIVPWTIGPEERRAGTERVRTCRYRCSPSYLTYSYSLLLIHSLH